MKRSASGLLFWCILGVSSVSSTQLLATSAMAAWTAQGPGPNLVPGFLGYTEVTGAVEIVAPHPTDPNRAYVGAANGGIWRTDDAMAVRPTWTPLTDFEPSLSITAIAFDPLDATHNTLYAGFGSSTRGLTHTGDANGPLPGLLLKTTDGGTTWSHVLNSAFANRRVQDIVPTTLVSGSNQILLVATTGGIFRSANSGKSWKQVYTGYVYDLVADPSSTTRFFASDPQGVMRSEDGGVTWNLLAGSPSGATLQLAISPIADELSRHWLYAAMQADGVYYSNDSGASWSAMDQPFPDGSHALGTEQGVTQVTVSPTNPRLVFCAGDGASWWRGDAANGPGAQWFALSGANTAGTATHTDSRSWAFSADPNVLFETDDGGIYRLRNAVTGSPVWESAIGNLSPTEFLTIAWDSVHDTVFGSCWDNSIPRQTTPDDPVWTVNENFFGDGMQVGVDNGTPGASVHYSSQQFLFGAQRQTVGGVTTTVPLGLDIDVGGGSYLHYNFLEGNIYPDNDNDLGTVRFDQTFAVNRVDGTRMVIGTDYLYESFDRGDHFISLGGIGLNVESDPIPLNPVGAVSAYYYGHPLDPDMLVIGVAAGQLWLRRNGLGYPTMVTTYPGSYLFDIAVDPDDPNRIFVLQYDGHVWRTVDGGATAGGWSDITSELGVATPDAHTLEVMRPAGGVGPSIVLVGGYGGVFAADDASSLRWRAFGGAFPNAIVSDISHDGDDDVLVAGTYGRGAWTLADATAEVSADACGTAPRSGCAAAAPGGSQLTVTAAGQKSVSWKWSSAGTIGSSHFGAPESVSAQVLCIYDASGTNAARASELMPAGGAWVAKKKGYSYKNKAGTPDGISKAKLYAGTPGKEQVKGKGPNVVTPSGSLTLPVTAQLLHGNGSCSEAAYGVATQNDGTTFKAKSN